jgi:NYN domain
MRQSARRTIVYVDGFNLYYGALRPKPQRPKGYRWLDLGALCTRVLPGDHIVGIKYFTALVHSAPWKPGQQKQSVAQLTYLRALGTIPHLTIHLGHFLSHPVDRRLVSPPRRGSPFREVWHTEEKGSDVNLASHLLIDGFRARYDLAVVISNDSDLKEPVHFVRHELKAPVGVLNPHPKRSWALSPPNLPLGSFYKPIRQGAVSSSQFAATLHDQDGSFRKPTGW